MRKYRKIWHILWLLVLALPVLAACARSQATPTSVPSDAASW